MGFIQQCSHTMKFVFELAHRLMVLTQGEVLMNRTPHEIRNDPQVIAENLGLCCSMVDWSWTV